MEINGLPLHVMVVHGAVVFGPLMTGFAEWIQGWCERNGERRVLCLMREGAFLAELIERCGEQLGGDLEAVPFWLNRTVLLRASIAEGSPEELKRFMHRRSAPTVEAICRELRRDRLTAIGAGARGLEEGAL